MTQLEILEQLERMLAGSNQNHQVWLEAQIEQLIRKMKQDDDAAAEELAKIMNIRV